MFIPAYFLQDHAEYYNVYKNLANRWIYGVWCSEYTKDNRLWTISRCSYLLLMAVLIAFLRDNQKWGQLIGVLIIQITYYILLWIRRPFHDPAVMGLQLLMHTVRIGTLLLALAFLIINDATLFSAATLQTCRYGLHGFVLIVWLLVRFQKLSRDILIFLFPNFCKCLQYDGWDELVVSNSNHNPSFEESAGSNQIKSRNSGMHTQTNATKKRRNSISNNTPINLFQQPIVPADSIPQISTPAKQVANNLSTPLSPSNSTRLSPINPASIEMPIVTKSFNDTLFPPPTMVSAIPPPPPPLVSEKNEIGSDAKNNQPPVLKRAFSKNEALFGKIRLRGNTAKISDNAGSSHPLIRNDTFSSVPEAPKRELSLVIEDDQDDSGDDEDDKSRALKAENFKKNLNFFQKLNQQGYN